MIFMLQHGPLRQSKPHARACATGKNPKTTPSDYWGQRSSQRPPLMINDQEWLYRSNDQEWSDRISYDHESLILYKHASFADS